VKATAELFIGGEVSVADATRPDPDIYQKQFLPVVDDQTWLCSASATGRRPVKGGTAMKALGLTKFGGAVDHGAVLRAGGVGHGQPVQGRPAGCVTRSERVVQAGQVHRPGPAATG
jgi:hypothetical protein